MLKRNLYKLHRSVSVLIGIPICLWAISGLLHPIMTNIRPQVTTQSPPVRAMDPATFGEPLGTALQNRHIDSFYRARKIWMTGKWYEQIRLTPTAIPKYLNVEDSSLIKNGDQQYACFLATHFLSGDDGAHPAIRSVRYLTKFSGDYPSVNRILPVYQVEFDRVDDLTIFVSTTQSQFSYARDNNRATFNWFFVFFHTWSWLDQFPGWKAGIIALILLLTLTTTCIGLYIAFTTKARPGKKHRLVKARRLHRLTALVAAVFMLAWAFSGLIHAVKKSLPARNGTPLSTKSFSSRFLPKDPAAILESLTGPGSYSFLNGNEHPLQVTDIEYLTIQQQPYMRVSIRRVIRHKRQT